MDKDLYSSKNIRKTLTGNSSLCDDQNTEFDAHPRKYRYAMDRPIGYSLM